MLRTILIFLLLSTSAFATDLAVKIINIKKPNSVLNITICPEAFINSDNTEKDCLINQTALISSESEYTFYFKDIPAGEWAIFGYIDSNKDGKLNTTIFGIPTEDVFYSVSVTPFFFKGVPKFKNIKSSVHGEFQEIILIAQ
ncbi:MAG: DUF2141 domain-containing protein [Alphaproteobacteria bacterium]|jgi:uncharacterized protein (DUF2141 family)|nr:DUF2141 domain-containing protein [Alphaproteobacteria bacterium]